MNTTCRRLMVTASTLITVAMLPAASAAQTTLQPIRVTDRQLRAEKLDADAVSIESSDWGQLKRAARLRESAARLRAADDSKGAVSLYWAARDSYYSGDKVAARALMVQSGERAMSIGDVLTAVSSFTEAAYIAADLRDAMGTREFASRARLLASSPMLTDAQRDELRLRLAQSFGASSVVASIAP